jgi:hypothetical protein
MREKFDMRMGQGLDGGGGSLTELRVSVKLLRSFEGVKAALRPRLARPFGVRESRSSVGESQNLEEKLVNCRILPVFWGLGLTEAAPSHASYSPEAFPHKSSPSK